MALRLGGFCSDSSYPSRRFEVQSRQAVSGVGRPKKLFGCRLTTFVGQFFNVLFEQRPSAERSGIRTLDVNLGKVGVNSDPSTRLRSLVL